MEFDVQEFKRLWREYKEAGVVFPSLRAWEELTGEYELVEVDSDNYYRSVELRKGKLRLKFIDCYTADALTNIQLQDESGKILFYSGQE